MPTALPILRLGPALCGSVDETPAVGRCEKHGWVARAIRECRENGDVPKFVVELVHPPQPYNES